MFSSSNTTVIPSPALLAKQFSAATDDDNNEEVTEQNQSEATDGLAAYPFSDDDSFKSTEELPATTELDVGSLAQSPTIPVSLESFVARSTVRVSNVPSRDDKPGLDDDTLLQYFSNCVAKEKEEMLMYILWCGICLSSSYPYELQGAILISNSCFYVLEITEQSIERGSWEEEKLPLMILVSEQLEHLSRIMLTGVMEQSIYVELHNKSPVCSFVLFPPTRDLTSQLFEQFKAALDASSLHYTVMETLKAKEATGLSGILFIIPDDFSTKRYKQWLSVTKTQVRLANFIATHKNKSLLGLYEVELKQGVRELADSIDIVHQVMVNSLSNDILPGNKGGNHLQPLTLVLTNSRLILCEEAFISGPTLRFTTAKHTFPPLTTIRSLPIKDIKEVTVCDTLQPVSSEDGMLYQVSFSFPSSVWYFILHDLCCFNNFMKSLKSLWNSTNDEELSVIHTTTGIKSFPQLCDPLPSITSQLQARGKGKISPPLFFKHLPLLRFASVPHWAKMEVFKEHIAQADFMKSDETILYVFLAHSQPHLEKRLEVEVFVIVSNYAMYFLSDTEGIRTWLDAGGVSSFARMSLLSSQNGTHLQCFYRLWLSDLVKVYLGPFLLSFRVYDGKSNSYIDVLTNNVQSTSIVISALAGTVGFKGKVKEKDMEHILEEFVDITDDVFGDNTPADHTLPITQFDKLSAVELVLPNELNELKLHLVESHPDVARGSSVKNCSESIQVLLPSVMLLAEQVRVRDSLLVHYRPHLLLLTNFGLFICGSSLNPDVTPTLLVLTPSQLVVKRWIRIDDVQQLQVAQDSQYHTPQLLVYTRPQIDSPGTNHVCLIPYNSVHTDVFVTLLAMMWEERMGQVLPVEYV